jgi:hypothetical protein
MPGVLPGLAGGSAVESYGQKSPDTVAITEMEAID